MTMASKRRTIAVVTGSRAESGLLLSTMRAVRAHPRLNLVVVVSGMHLVSGSWRDIKSAGFTIDAKVSMQVKGKSGRSADVAALGKGITGFGQTFDRIKPDVVLVLGDRIEVLAAASAASVGGYRLAHIHGGDRAEGVADEAIRHAVSKLAHLHLPATAQSKRRLARMGEQPHHIHHVGSPAIDGLGLVEPANDAPELIVMQHPVGESDKQESAWMRATLLATKPYKRLVLMPNRDPGSDGIRRAIAGLRVQAIDHLPRQRFLSLLKGAKAIVGNSSAGLIEAAGMRTSCVNVGPRQNGREKPGNVIDCAYGRGPISAAIRKALRLDLRRLHHPYGNGTAGGQIANLLATIDLRAIPIRKQNTY